MSNIIKGPIQCMKRCDDCCCRFSCFVQRGDSGGDAAAEPGAFFFESAPSLGPTSTNPFSVQSPSLLPHTKGFALLGRSDSFVEDMGVSGAPPFAPAPDAPAARSRFAEDFDTLCLLGSGEFGRVLKCRNKMDACDYAVRKLACRPSRALQLSETYAATHARTHPPPSTQYIFLRARLCVC